MGECADRIRAELEQVEKDLHESNTTRRREQEEHERQVRELHDRAPIFRDHDNEEWLRNRKYDLRLKLAVAEVVEEMILPELRRIPNAR